MAGAVKGLRDRRTPTRSFAMAGDIVGASTFESFIQNDKPTIDAMNEAGLEVSAAGNHEFDQGYDDLMDRIMSAYDADRTPRVGPTGPTSRPTSASATTTARTPSRPTATDGNFAHSNGATWWKDFPSLNGGDGISVGFVGAVTEDLDSLVAPVAIDGPGHHQHRRRGQRRCRRPQGRRLWRRALRPGHRAGARGCSQPELRHHQERRGLHLRSHRPRGQRRRRRDHLRPHAPQVQLQGGRGGQDAATVRWSRPASTAPTSTSSSSTSRPAPTTWSASASTCWR